MGLKIKKWLTNSQFELREARAPRQPSLRSLQALVGEHAQRQTQLTPESHHRIKVAPYSFLSARADFENLAMAQAFKLHAKVAHGIMQ